MTSRAAVVFAEEVVARHGRPYGDKGGDLVRVSLSQQELAKDHRCAASTISWYLRCLGSAVVERRGGIIFDRAAIRRLSSQWSARPLAPRTASVERHLVKTYARPTADGACVELVTDTSSEAKPPSLQDLAAELGINRSSAHRHVSALEQAGRLQRRGRRLYLVDIDHPREEPAVNDPPLLPPARHDAAAGVSAQQLLELLDKMADVMTAVAGLAQQLLASQSANTGAQDPRFGGAQIADESPLRAAKAADGARGFSSVDDLIDKTDSQVSSDQSAVRAADSRTAASVRAKAPRTEAPDWTPEDLPGLLAPLLEGM